MSPGRSFTPQRQMEAMKGKGGLPEVGKPGFRSRISLRLPAIATATVTARGSMTAASRGRMTATARMDVGATGVAPVPSTAPTIKPTAAFKPWTVPIDDPPAVSGDDASGPGKQKTGYDKRAKESIAYVFHWLLAGFAFS